MAKKGGTFKTIFIILIVIIAAGLLFSPEEGAENTTPETTNQEEETENTEETEETSDASIAETSHLSVSIPEGWEESFNSDEVLNISNKDNPSEEVRISYDGKTEAVDALAWAETQDWPFIDPPAQYFAASAVDGIPAIEDVETNKLYVVKDGKVFRIENGTGFDHGIVDGALFQEILNSVEFK